jgi:hypothetical protein
MGDWLEKEDLKFALQIGKCAEALPAYAGTFNLTPAQVDAVKNDADFVGFVITKVPVADAYKQNWVKLKDQVRYGKNGDVLAQFPSPVDVATPPIAVEPNVEKRFRDFARTIKAHKNYTKGIGEVLGIEGVESAEEDTSTWKPILKVKIQAGSPDILWTKGKSSGIKIWVDRGDGQGFKFLGTDTIPNFLDKHTLPAQGQTVLWKYQAHYILDDEEVGEMSDVLEVSVKGRVE